ncbi:hypothetical protein TNCV_3825781 [Trichonephila clavipes]|nr:hypothetical protein TNCV_3825781 [Trichonephila clavipes]
MSSFKKYKCLTISGKQNVIESVEEGERKVDVDKAFEIPLSSLSTILKNKEKFFSAFSSRVRKRVSKDNCTVHNNAPPLSDVKLQFPPPNSTSKLQPLDQGIIHNFKTFYRREVVNPPTGQHGFFCPTREASKTDHTKFFSHSLSSLLNYLRAFGDGPVAGVPGGQGIESWLACLEFESSATKDPPCRAAMHVKSIES